MGFGASLAFIAIGAVLAFAVKWDIPGIDLQMIGWIFMGVGVVGAVLTGLYTRRPRSEEVVEMIEPDLMYTVDPDPVEPHVHVRHEETVEPHVRVRHEETEPLPHVHRDDPYRNGL
jgi:hypothetical protein